MNKLDRAIFHLMLSRSVCTDLASLDMHSLFCLTNELGGLLSSLEEDSSRVARLRGYWLNLETIYAVNDDANVDGFSRNEKEIIEESVVEIRKLISHVLEQYLQESDKAVTSIATVLDDKWLMCPDCIDAWESVSKTAMVICPKCDNALHNPRYG